jgi:hypothetical protein
MCTLYLISRDQGRTAREDNEGLHWTLVNLVNLVNLVILESCVNG